VPDLKDGDLLTGIVYEVNNTKVALADSIPVVISGEFLALLRARTRGQGSDPVYDASTVFLRTDGLDFLSCRGL
jgi:hypothetical protein